MISQPTETRDASRMSKRREMDDEEEEEEEDARPSVFEELTR